MRNIFRIARTELSTLFFSPIAWFLLILFLIQGTVVYLDYLEGYLTLQEMGYPRPDLTFMIFSDEQNRGMFIINILENLYLYIPLITMGLISRENSTGTIKLLYSSPIKLSEIVLGKYLAMLGFNLFMVSMLLIISLFAAMHIESVDFGLLISSLLGFFLLLSAYAGIGIFMSCLSTYQVVAALGTFALFALLKYIGTVWQEYEFFRDLTYSLSIAQRTQMMIQGLINTRDVIYYLSITFMFLIFAWLKLKGVRQSISWTKMTLNYGIVVVVTLSIGYISSDPRFIGYFDATTTHRKTISINTQQTLEELGSEPLEVTTYINLLDKTYYHQRPEARNEDKARWERYLRFKPDIKLEYVYYYDSISAELHNKYHPGKTLEEVAKKMSKARKVDLSGFKKPVEIQKIINLYPENNRLVSVLKFKGKETFLRNFDDPGFWASENEVSAALKRLTGPLPKIAFLVGEEERSVEKTGSRHYKLATKEPNVRESLINQGFNSDSISLKNQDIPEGLAALVIADPRREFEPAVLEKILKYIEGGGNLLLAGEPGKQDVLNPILKQLGVQLMDGTIVQGDKNFGPDEVQSFVSVTESDFGRSVARLQKDSTVINTFGAAGLIHTPGGRFKIETLLTTDQKNTWNKGGKVVLDSADIIFNPAAGDEKKAIPTALALTRKINGKEQRILVTGDADFLSNAALAKQEYPKEGVGNPSFFAGLLGWFTYGKFPVEPSWPDPIDNHIKLTGEQTGLVKTVMFSIPGLLLLGGTILLIRRKRK